MVAILLFVSLILFLLLSIPIGVSLGLASLTTIRTMDCISMTTFVQSMIQGLNSFPLMAVPLFTFAGEVMGKGGISRRLIDLARVFTGRFTGGLGIVTIVTSLFFAAIAGTGSAAVAAIGLIMIPAMVKNGYDKGYSSALVATAGTVGVIIPPSVCMVVYAVAAGASISGLFMAGIMPGLLIGAGLILYSVFYSRRHGYKGEDKRYTPGEIWQIILKAIPGLMIPVIILGGIYGGIFTPTEAAAVSVVYGLFVGIFIYKKIRLKEFYALLLDTTSTTATVMFITAAASLFAYVLTRARLDVAISSALHNATGGNVIVFFIIVNIILLIAGCFLDSTSALYIFTPLFVPVAQALGVNLIHLGVVMIVNLAIGLFTPPVGVNLYVACGVGNVNLKQISKAVVSLIIAALIVLLLVTYIPKISLLFV